MKRRLLVAISVAAVSAFVALQSLPLQGQGQVIGAGAPDLVITAYNGGPPIPYTVPRTPWGDPDLQGTWSSDDAQFGGGGGGRGGARGGAAAGGARAGGARGTGGRGGPPGPPPLYLNDEQFAARQKAIADGVVNRENNATSTFRNDFARRAFRQTRTIVDPRGRSTAAHGRSQKARRSP